MATQEWYVQIATAIQRRNHALTMVGKWQEKVAAAETEIDELKAQQDTEPEPVPEQAAA